MRYRVAIIGPVARSDQAMTVGGVAIHTAAIAAALREEHVDVAILSDTHTAEEATEVAGIRGAELGTLARIAIARPITTATIAVRCLLSPERKRLRLPLKRTVSRAMLIRAALDEGRAELVHVQQADFRPLYLNLSGWRGPRVITVHGLGALETAEYPALKEIIPQHLLSASLVTVPSAALKREVSSLGVPASRVHTIPNAVNHELFHPIDGAGARANLGLPEGAPILLFMGRITAHKGVPDLLTAFESVRKTHPEARLAFVGPWSLDRPKPTSTEMITVREATPREHVPFWLNAATLTIVPSLYEGFGLTALESLACGTPVVATRVGGLAEMIDETVGALVEPGSPTELANAITRLLDEPARMSRLAANAVDRAAGYTWAKSAHGFKRLYDTVERDARE